MPIDDMHLPINYSLDKSDNKKKDIEGTYTGHFKIIGDNPVKLGIGRYPGVEEAIIMRETEKSNVAYLEVKKLKCFSEISKK
jgi:hypothetical protein